ncbi:MAG TPA: hypothetical protein VF683_02730 [Chthoniobacterales bacterium]
MKLRPSSVAGFSLSEALVAVSISSLLFAGIFVTSVALTRAYSAADDYFGTHLQQIRIMDYLARDVKRSFSVTTTADKRTVTCIMPDYVVQAGDPEALSDPNALGIRRTPVVVGPVNKAFVDYGTRGTRTLTDGTLASGSTTLTSATAAFAATDVGNPIAGTGIQTGTTIASRTSPTQVTLSKPATAGGSGRLFTLYGDGNRTVTDAITNNGATTLTSNTAYFTSADVGKPVVGTTIPAGTTIVAVTNPTTVTLSAGAVNPTQQPTNVVMNPFTSTITIGGTVVVYAVSGNTITRTENGVLTTIASSTDNLLPETTDWQQSNTEYTTTNVTFQPILSSGDDHSRKQWKRSGTAVYATAYLRNKRRGN